MSAYRDALTKLFLRGSFSKGDDARPARIATTPARFKAPAEAVRDVVSPVSRRRSASPAATVAQPDTRSAAQASDPKPASSSQDHSHPGKLLANKLRAHGKTASDLARDMHVPVNRVTAIINGQRGVTADTALRFGHWFGETPESWLEAQQRYELARARVECGAAIRRLPHLSPSR